jgi:glycosyltransferase involved in cell wall biosynthesis/CDP-glycerol glycerophosphotransferase (TagB/SpsB family)
MPVGRSGHLLDERFALEASGLRVFCRSVAQVLTFAIRQAGGQAQVTPAMRVGDEYAGGFDLGQIPPGDYEILATLAGGNEMALGARTAALRGMIAPARRQQVASLVVDRPVPRHAWIWVDLVEGRVHLRVSESDDLAVFLAGNHATADTRPSTQISFSVISAVYNVEKYLDDYFRSLTTQSIDFRSRIEVVLVDDGSTDRSAKIIRRWQKSYPKNVKYLHKANGGPGSARNLGLDQVSNDWVTFIDPDDFVDPRYFEEVAGAIGRHELPEHAVVSGNITRYIEKTRAILDNHPLRFRYASGERMVAVESAPRDIQLSVNNAFFRRRALQQAAIRFDERIRPSFEDAHFIVSYLTARPDTKILFVPRAKYLYRFREDHSSILQTRDARPELHAAELEHGHLALLEQASRTSGHAPVYVQNVVLYSLSWRLNSLVDNVAAALIPEPQKDESERWLRAICSHIDVETILDYDIANLPYAFRLGILNRFKDTQPSVPRVEVTGYDDARGLVRLVYWSRHEKPSATFSSAGTAVAPVWKKLRPRRFLGRPFIFEHIAWVPIGRAGSFAAVVDDTPARLFIRGVDLPVDADVARIRTGLVVPPPAAASLPAYARDLRAAARSAKAVKDFANAWLFLDRDDSADDSAEELYRFVRRAAPEINSRFILRRDSADWRRLTADGFRLLPFNEPEHAIALLNATHLISSQADHYVFSYLGAAEFGDMLNYRLIFLQHGVVKDDISGWLNQVPFDLMATSTPAERDSIIADGSPYRFTGREIALTGLPRHDALLAAPRNDAGTIVIMPTWRSSLTGAATGPGNARSTDRAFYGSEFARRWKTLLHSSRLADIARKHARRLVFVPHPNLEQYLGHFDLPKHVELRRFGGGQSLQPTFRDLSLFVTDYSSKAFDMALLEKPVVYYQFDPEVFFGGGHTSRPGYFDYERDGFGPVCSNEADVLDAIDKAVAGDLDPAYRERAASTFPFRDGKCSERVFAAIKALGDPL